jgi:large subunit ribosomal protein L15
MEKPIAVNLDLIEISFEKGATVTPATLVEKTVIETVHGIIPRVKILASGEITKAVTVTGCLVSKEAKAKIEKAGGSVK